MIVGILKDTSPGESRVVLVPEDASRLVAARHRVIVETGAGRRAGWGDAEYREAGAEAASTARDLLIRSRMALRVKEPSLEEVAEFHPGQVLGCFIKIDRHPTLVTELKRKRVAALALQRVEAADGTRPLLKVMSVIAGQQAVLQGMQFLGSHLGGAGISLAPIAGIAPARVVVLGGGTAGSHAAAAAAALGASVFLFEKNVNRIRTLRKTQPPGIDIFDIADFEQLELRVVKADMLINTVPLAPRDHLVNRSMVSRMKKGSVIVDVAAQPGGAIETVDRLTTLANPIWQVDGVIHYAVPNIPGAVARTASQALSRALLPYLLLIAKAGLTAALSTDAGLLKAFLPFDRQRRTSYTKG